ncbi:hypothetical protein E2C01_052403 [Portunus trituberculatus]|uniref:Uncharacterized protein n=1 Tax=Portunus trituberculatus TaxID=210409 RepID=A0A5B7GLG8_PORTR|nr:hypothetical protein [Portunus trituberculatus]
MNGGFFVFFFRKKTPRHALSRIIKDIPRQNSVHQCVLQTVEQDAEVFEKRASSQRGSCQTFCVAQSSENNNDWHSWYQRRGARGVPRMPPYKWW